MKGQKTAITTRRKYDEKFKRNALKFIEQGQSVRSVIAAPLCDASYNLSRREAELIFRVHDLQRVMQTLNDAHLQRIPS
jgi:hypothetical protein